MTPAATPPNPKHAWSHIRRAPLPKRAAAERVADYGEIYDGFDEATVQVQASRCIQCPDPLCRRGCPLANRIPEWLALAAEGRFAEAAEISRSTSNLPEICARVCPQERLCEGACILNARTDPVAIGAVERFINDYALVRGQVEATVPPPNGKRVAVIGSGPGGMACADQLAGLGYAVTIFEALTAPGGLLVNGIPSFKLAKAHVARRIELLQRRGVQLRLGVRVGWDLPLEALRRDFDAVFVGVGAQKPKELDIPGGNLRGIVPALPFLIAKNVDAGLSPSGDIQMADRRAVVLGGGDTAMDCLRTAIRAGAREAVCIYRRDLANMPGSRKEYANAIEEGARFEFLTNPTAILGTAEGHVAAVQCVRMELGAADASGRRKPRPVAGSEFQVAADTVLVAYGFDAVRFPEGSDFAALATDEWGGLVVDQRQMTSVEGVFAGGDSSRGPSLVVHAVRDGRKAAAGIHAFLNPAKK